MEAVSPDTQLAEHHPTLTAMTTVQNSLAVKPLDMHCQSDSQALECSSHLSWKAVSFGPLICGIGKSLCINWYL